MSISKTIFFFWFVDSSTDCQRFAITNNASGWSPNGKSKKGGKTEMEKKKEIRDFRSYYLKEFQFFDGEDFVAYITWYIFNIGILNTFQIHSLILFLLGQYQYITS